MSNTILIVDDDESITRTLVQGLHGEGVVVEIAATVDEARQALESGPVDTLCLDLNLPDGDGFDFLQTLKESHPALSTIVISGHDTAENRARAKALGALAFIAKPFALSTLRTLVLDGGGSAAVHEIRPNGKPCSAVAHEAESPSPSVLMYSHDSVGLGHMRRNSNIAGRLVDETPAASALMVIGCPTGVFFDLPAGVDCLKLPSVQKVATNTWQPRHLKIPVAQARALRASLIEQTVEIMQPRVLLVDHMPGGVWGEIVPALRAAREVDDPPKIVLGLRDILDRPEVVRATWEADGLYDLIAECYDGILIYGQRDVFDTAAAYGLDGPDMPVPVYCGYIGSEAPVVDAATLRARRGIGSGDFVVVTAGGGADAFPMMAASMQALAALDPGERPYALFITGPLMAPADRAELRQAAAALPAEVVDVVTDLPSYLNAADLVVTMGGYNTLIEAIRLNKRAIVIPRTGPSAEQRLRAELLDGLGIVKALMPEDVAPGRLARLVKDVLAGPPPAVGLEINGLETAVDYLSTMLCEGTEYVTSSAKVQAAV